MPCGDVISRPRSSTTCPSRNRQPSSTCWTEMAEGRRIAIITGGTRGIGAAITRRLVQDGAHVCAVFHSARESAEALRDELIAQGGSVTVHRGDVGDRTFCRRLVDEVVAAHGWVDYLVNNAGLLV